MPGKERDNRFLGFPRFPESMTHLCTNHRPTRDLHIEPGFPVNRHSNLVAPLGLEPRSSANRAEVLAAGRRCHTVYRINLIYTVSRIKMVGREGFQPSVSILSGWRFRALSYPPKTLFISASAAARNKSKCCSNPSGGSQKPGKISTPSGTLS